MRGYRAAWRNLGRWQEVINDRATKALEESLARSENQFLFATKFREMPEPERMRCIASKIGVLPPRWTGDRLPAWNASWSVWKGVVWHYKISRFSNNLSHLNNTADLAQDKWLGLLLGWPNDDISIETRRKNLWFWLRDLERLGYVEYIGCQLFRFHGGKAPKGFLPWNRIK